MSVMIEKNADVTTIILDRPKVRNAVDPETATRLFAAFHEFEADPQAKVAVLHGAHGVFCSGWDLRHAVASQGQLEVQELAIPKDDASEWPRGPMGPSRLELSKPVIAAIAGPAVAGGMELALWCDLRVMEETAYMGVFCRRWGVPLVDGGTVRLPRLIGLGKALDLILTGRQVLAEECYRIGLCERVVPSGQAREVAETMAQQIARFPQECLRADRQSVFRQQGLSLREALRHEWNNSIAVVQKEGITGADRFVRGKGRHGDFSDC